jgi:Ca2+/Na+ antiporter
MEKKVDLREPDENISNKNTSRLAISSLISAAAAVIFVVFYFPAMFIYIQHRHIEGFFVLAAVIFSHLAFLLGIVAIVVIAFNRRRLKGDWYALLAILLSVPFLLVTASGIYVNRGRVEQKKTSEGRSIALAIVEYARNHDGYLPDANQWCDLLIEYYKKLPKDRFKYDPVKYRFKYDSSKVGICNYAFNRNLIGVRIDNMSYNTVLVFESEGKWNLSGTEELLKKTPKKRQYVYVYTKDAETGHDFPRAINIKDTAYDSVLWEPSHIK